MHHSAQVTEFKSTDIITDDCFLSETVAFFPHWVESGGEWNKLNAGIISLLGRIHQNQQWSSKWPVIKVAREMIVYKAELNGAGLTEKITT